MTLVYIYTGNQKKRIGSGHRKETLLGLRNLISARTVIMDWLISRSRKNISTSFERFRLYKNNDHLPISK